MDASGIGRGLQQMAITIFVVAVILGTLLAGGIVFFTRSNDDEIISEYLIQPEEKLIINDKQEVDTLYIYHRP